MKIDLHCHTRKSKSGDPITRDVDVETFYQNLIDSDVRICAITNHNLFDMEQFKEFKLKCGDNILLLPGIELDVKLLNGNIAHCIVVASDKELVKFNNLYELLYIHNVDEYSIDISQLGTHFNSINHLLIPHYLGKSPVFVQKDINYLTEINSTFQVIAEPTNIRTAGILHAHNQKAIVGSDVRDWNDYNGTNLPSMKIGIDTFESLFRFFKKDMEIIETTLSKYPQKMMDVTFRENDFKLNIFEDVNIIFGNKGTGKSELLLDLKETFKTLGHEVRYFDAHKHQESYNSIIGFDLNLLQCNPKYIGNKRIFEEALVKLSELIELKIEHPKYFIEHAKESRKKLNYDKLQITKFNKNLINETILSKHKMHFEKANNAIDVINNIVSEHRYLEDEKNILLCETLDFLEEKIIYELENEWRKITSLQISNRSIEKIKKLASSKTGIFEKPSSIGIYDFLKKYSTIIDTLEKIRKILDESYNSKSILGEIEFKGIMYKNVQVASRDKYQKNSKISNDGLNIAKIKKFKEKLNSILNGNIKNFIDEINGLIAYISEENINNYDQFLGQVVDVCDENNALYNPSSGEQAMLLVSNSLCSEEFDVYILDEPELSVGHDYINNSILPRIKTLADNNKIVIISTHDANIAIRTQPLNTIFREYKNGKYETYIGNSFNSKLKCIHDRNEPHSWVEKSVQFLEGGKDAFIERSDIYEIR